MIIRTFFKPTDQFCSNNATNNYHLTTHSTTCCPTKCLSCRDHRFVA